jgi:probable phosphoglycerate mutase
MSLIAIRHGETEWNLNGRHTGTMDIPLTDDSRRLAELLRPALSGRTFPLVLVSPLQRARQTCELAGVAARAIIEPDLAEWDYGKYEGLTPREIDRQAPGWLIFRDKRPGGEISEQVGARADRGIARTCGRGRRRAVRARTRVARARGALAPAALRPRATLPARHGYVEGPRLLPRNPRAEDLECAARGLRVAAR